jgi:hypothetical protein
MFLWAPHSSLCEDRVHERHDGHAAQCDSHVPESEGRVTECEGRGPECCDGREPECGGGREPDSYGRGGECRIKEEEEDTRSSLEEDDSVESVYSQYLGYVKPV